MTTGLRVWHSTIGKPAAVVVAAAVQLAAVSCGESVAVQQPSRVGIRAISQRLGHLGVVLGVIRSQPTATAGQKQPDDQSHTNLVRGLDNFTLDLRWKFLNTVQCTLIAGPAC